MHPAKTLRPLAAALALCLCGAAAAQQKPATAPAPSAGPRAVPAAPAPTAPAAREETDGEAMAGRWGAAFFGRNDFEFAAVAGQNRVSVFTIGVRHWGTQPLGPFKAWGADLGFGLVVGRGKVKTTQASQVTTTDAPSATGFGFHAGVPLAVTHGKHVTFELVPEGDLVFASSTVIQTGGVKSEWTAWALRLGARAGLEVHFGFIGIRELSLEASVSAGLTYGNQTNKTGPLEDSRSSWRFGTGKENEPWSIFTGNVAAIYYF